MQEERFWLLASLILSSEATPDELAEMDALMQSNPEMGLQWTILSNIWNEKLPGLNSRKEDAFSKHLQRLSNHLSEPALKYETEGSLDDPPIPHQSQNPFRQRKWILLAGGVAASVICFFLMYHRPEQGKKTVLPIAQNTVSTNLGSKSKIQLPDGSLVWLNADSRIIYKENFQGPFREVQLTGEAFFEVVKDKEHPFIIHTQSIDLKVLGTAFNVRSYTNEKKTETSLIRGSIEVTLHDNPDKKIVLKPNEKLIVQNNRFTMVRDKPEAEANEEDEPMMILSKVHFQRKDSSATETLWVKNKLAFDSESLENVALKIERWYDVKVIIKDDKLKSNEYSGVFEDESLPQVMEALRLTGNFKYSINKKEIIIRP